MNGYYKLSCLIPDSQWYVIVKDNMSSSQCNIWTIFLILHICGRENYFMGLGWGGTTLSSKCIVEIGKYPTKVQTLIQ